MSATARARQGVWAAVRSRRGVWERNRAPDEAPLRRISWRLAALTVGLLCVLLLALGITLYGTTQAAVQGTMRQTLQTRVVQNIMFARAQLLPRAYEPGIHGLGPLATPGPPIGPAPNTSGSFCVVATTSLRYVTAADGNPFGQALPDRVAARLALRTERAVFSTQVRATGARYLLYSAPVRADGRIWGVIQAGLLEQPYLAGLDLLMRTLLLVSLAGLLAVGVISGVLVQRALRPIRVALRRQRDFVADAAHELRTPVTILRNAAELGLVSVADLGLPSALVADQQAAYAQTLAQSSHLARLVDDLALLAQADSGAVTLERAPVDLARLVAETTAGMEMLAEDRGARLDVVLSGATRVVGDAGRLRQVVLVLLDNALKHTPAGGIITIAVQRQGNDAHLQVRDTGRGIAPRDLPHVFDRFYRADGERGHEGSGLGLAIARWIVEAHGGRIMAANAPDGGAVFIVTLPLAR